MKNILLHGLGQTSSSWNNTVASMENKLDILCPNLFDLLQDKEVSYANLYQVFSEYCTGLSEPFNICGLSLGGILALEYVIKNPTKVNSLVLIGTQYTMPKGLLKFQNIVFHLMPNRMFMEIGLGKKDCINLIKSMLDLDFQHELQKITCPVFIVCGEKDIANKKASLQLSKQIPNTEITFIKNAGHEVNMEAPKELGQILNTFLDRTNSRF
ncbi:MAG: alpha/beta fold hydrolase [Clostridiales bacterium]|nr:alpha/beta fold hydrolase [Clostridiales bacterium]